MNWGVPLGQSPKLNQADSFLTCDKRSLGKGVLPCLQERGGRVELPEIIRVAANLSLPSFTRD